MMFYIVMLHTSYNYDYYKTLARIRVPLQGIQGMIHEERIQYTKL